MDNWLKELACPICHRKLSQLKEQVLSCKHCKVEYPVKDNIAYLIPPGTLNDSSYSLEINRYNKIARKGADVYDGLQDTFPIRRAELVREILKDRNIKKFVNVGVGFGDLEKKTTDFEVFSVDPCNEFLKIVKNQNPKIHCINAIAEALPFPENSIGCLVSESTFQSINNRLKFLYEIGRITKPGSLIVINIGYKWHYPRKPQDGFNINIPIERKTLELFLAELGFEVEYKYHNIKRGEWKSKKEDADYLWIIGKKKE